MKGNKGNEIEVIILIEMEVEEWMKDEGVDIMINECKSGGLKKIMRKLNERKDEMRIKN